MSKATIPHPKPLITNTFKKPMYSSRDFNTGLNVLPNLRPLSKHLLGQGMCLSFEPLAFLVLLLCGPYSILTLLQYTSLKGLCEDFDEGKLPFPLIHCLNMHFDAVKLYEVLRQRQDQGCMSTLLKRLVLKYLKESNSVEYTRDKLQSLERQITGEIARLESMTGKENWILRLCMEKLYI